jgi:hypothetical protein
MHGGTLRPTKASRPMLLAGAPGRLNSVCAFRDSTPAKNAEVEELDD